MLFTCVLHYGYNITHYSCQILTKLEFSRRIFEKSSHTKFRENLSGGIQAVPCGET